MVGGRLSLKRATCHRYKKGKRENLFPFPAVTQILSISPDWAAGTVDATMFSTPTMLLTSLKNSFSQIPWGHVLVLTVVSLLDSIPSGRGPQNFHVQWYEEQLLTSVVVRRLTMDAVLQLCDPNVVKGKRLDKWISGIMILTPRSGSPSGNVRGNMNSQGLQRHVFNVFTLFKIQASSLVDGYWAQTLSEGGRLELRLQCLHPENIPSTTASFMPMFHAQSRFRKTLTRES